jgi:hypothetical protein
MKERVILGATVAHGRSRAGRIILEIIATALIAAALGTSHAQVSSEPSVTRAQAGANPVAYPDGLGSATGEALGSPRAYFR